MNLFKKIYAVSATSCLLSMYATAAPTAPLQTENIVRYPFEGKTIIFGTDASYMPFEYHDAKGEITGFDIEIAKAMCAQMKANCEVKDQTWDGIIPSLLTKKYDVIASSMDITNERKKAVAFTQKIWVTPSNFVAKKGVSFTTTAEGLKGKRIGVQKYTSQHYFVEKHFKQSTIKPYLTTDAAYTALLKHQIDTVFADGVIVRTFFLDKKMGVNYTLVGEPIKNTMDKEIFGEGTGFAVRKEDTELLKELNRSFDAIRASGQYEQIAKEYFNFDVYGD